MPANPHGEAEAEVSVLRGLRWAFVLTLVVLAIETAGAVLSRSLSLTSDAVHNVPDAIVFAVSWAALASTARGATPGHTFGLHRVEVFAALANACLVLATGALFAYEGSLALWSRSPLLGTVDPLWIFAAALPTLLLRAIAAVVVGRIPRRARDLNLKSVFLHLLSDLAIVGAILFAGAVIWLRPGYAMVDPVAALFVSVILIVESFPLFRESWASLSEEVPRHLSIADITRVAKSVPHVEDLHDVHVWSVCSSLVCMTAHIRTENLTVRDSMQVVAELKERLSKDFGIVHAVFEVEAGDPQGSHRVDAAGCVVPG